MRAGSGELAPPLIRQLADAAHRAFPQAARAEPTPPPPYRGLPGNRPEDEADEAEDTSAPSHPAAPRLAAGATAPAGQPTVLADRPDATVIRCGAVVAKAHAPDTAAYGGQEPAALTARLRLAADPRAAGILLAPLSPDTAPLPGGRTVTLWPYGVPVSPEDPDAVPWAEAGTLLGRLHSLAHTDLPTPLPPMRGPAKAAQAVRRLTASANRDTAAARTVLRAWAGLPPWARDEGPGPGPYVVCHGDLHLGQLVRHPAPDGPWRLIDIDDLGIGVPAWDLARPAAWYAAGLLAPADWDRFLAAYRAAGGPGAGRDGDPWPALDVPARALTVQSAATALAKAEGSPSGLEEAAQAMVDACARIICLD